MFPAEVIARKRDGQRLSRELIAYFVHGFVQGRVTDYQMSAMAMAIYFQGMDVDEIVTLTQEMKDSGDHLRWSTSIPKVDKHSTGGQGDKVSIVLAPLLACCGMQVPMISGRGLGITGGTLDKLESIPGFRTDLSLTEIQSQTEAIGCVITGANEQIAPADRRMYALRDVTATVESVPLIAASVLCKKLAESLDGLVLDVKFGSGAFMTDIEQARHLARTMVSVADRMGIKASAMLTNMNQPLGQMVGNTVEIAEAVSVLQGYGPPDVRELTCALGAQLLFSEGRATSLDEAARRLNRLLSEGTAYARFEQMVAAQGGRFPAVAACPSTEVLADRAGRIMSIRGRDLGHVVVQLGGGRRHATDPIDPTVGLEILVRLGQDVSRQQPLARIFAQPSAASVVVSRVRAAFEVAPGAAEFLQPKLIAESIF